MTLRIFNTITRTIQEFTSLIPGVVNMYTCGPTVYRHAHIGNFRTYLLADWIRRILQIQGYTINHIKNITDVGHMRQEVLEQGEDKVISAAIAEGKTPQEIANFYTKIFLEDESKLNILPAKIFPRATNHVPEMIELIKKLLDLGFAYEVNKNIYFSVHKFPRYGSLSGNLDGSLLDGVRIDPDPLKLDSRDFTLWKSAEEGRTLKWESPWGDGFPGWHIECSAMAMKYLGSQLDIHTGGVDNIFPHHEGEIAQSEAVTGETFVQYWIHGQHLLADGLKMAKSIGNAYTLSDLESRGFDPLALRYLYLTARTSARLNFTFSTLNASQQAFNRLKRRVWEYHSDGNNNRAGTYDLEGWRDAFWAYCNNNLDLPNALATLWKLIHSEVYPKDKLELILEFDNVLGLDLVSVS